MVARNTIHVFENLAATWSHCEGYTPDERNQTEPYGQISAEGTEKRFYQRANVLAGEGTGRKPWSGRSAAWWLRTFGYPKLIAIGYLKPGVKGSQVLCHLVLSRYNMMTDQVSKCAVIK